TASPVQPCERTRPRLRDQRIDPDLLRGRHSALSAHGWPGRGPRPRAHPDLGLGTDAWARRAPRPGERGTGPEPAPAPNGGPDPRGHVPSTPAWPAARARLPSRAGRI